MRNCDYGCNLEGQHLLKNGKYCCSESPNSCSAKRNKDSLKKKGKKFSQTARYRTNPPKWNPWNKGLKFVDDPRWKGSGKKAAATKRALGLTPGHAKTEEAEVQRRLRISETMKNNPKAGGLREGSGRGKKCWYESSIAGRVYLRSTYELEYARYLDSISEKWIQNAQGFSYLYENQIRTYYPDFYLVDQDCYVEVKGFETHKDREKWSQFPHKLVVLKKEDLLALGLNLD
jgi:hypothetical protein